MEITLTLVELAVVATASVAAAAVLGWWWRGRSQSTQRAVLDELWTRKLRAMEVALEESETYRTREGTQLRQLQDDLGTKRDELASAKQAYSDATEHIGDLKTDLERRHLDIESLDRAGSEMAERKNRAVAELEQERARSSKLAAKVKRLAPLTAQLAEREEELARLDRRHATELDARDAEVRRQADLITELSSLPDALKSREVDVRELRECLRAEAAKGEERASEAEEQLAVLDAEKRALAELESGLRESLATREAELELLRVGRDELTQRAEELGARADRLEGAAAEIDARIERDRQGAEDVAAAERDQAASDRERLARLLAEREEDLADARRTLAATRSEQASAKLELRSMQRRVEELNRSDARRADGAPRKRKTTGKADVDDAAPKAKPKDPAPETSAVAPDSNSEPNSRPKAPEPPKSKPAAAQKTSPAKGTNAESKAKEAEAKQAEAQKAPVEQDDSKQPATEKTTARQVDAKQGAAKRAGAEQTPAKQAKHAKTRPAAAKTALFDEEVIEGDEPQVTLKPHRAVPPSMPTFPGVDEPKSKASKASKAKSSRRQAPASSKTKPADDFTRIRGIGPRTAEKLVAAGVTNYADFSALSGDALAEIADAIGTAASKIKSSGWQKSARRLAKSKH